MVCKVLHVIPSLASGGAERQLVNLINSTSAAIEHVVCVIRSDTFFAPEIATSGSRVVVLGIEGKHPFFSAALAIRKLIREEVPDVINTWLYDANVTGRMASLGSGIPVVTSLQSPDYDPIAIEAGKWNPVKVKILRFIDKVTHRITNPYFVACSKFVKHSYQEFFGISDERIMVIYNGVDLERLSATSDDSARIRLELGISENCFVYLNVGRLDRAKNQIAAIEAFHSIAAEIPNVYLLIAGAGPSDTFLKDSMSRLGLEGKVIFLGRRQDIGALLETADVFVFPSMLEGLPVALAEAMFKSLPCVASKIPVFEEIITDRYNGVLVDPNSPDEIGAAMRDLYGDPLLREKLGDNAYRVAKEKFNASSTALAWEDLYIKVSGVPRG